MNKVLDAYVYASQGYSVLNQAYLSTPYTILFR